MQQVLRLLCPYPTIGEDGRLEDGLTLAQPRICRKCGERDCWSQAKPSDSADLLHCVCRKGLSLVLCRFGESLVLCNGLIVKQRNTVCSRAVRKQIQDHKVAWEEIAAWRTNLSKALPLLEDAAEREAQEAIHGLHDVKTAVSLVTRNAEGIIATLDGSSDEDRIDNAPKELRALLKSVELLHTRLSASSILANPEAASHGQRHPTPVHRICYKMVRLFQEVAARSNTRIRIVGMSYATPLCYDSFETIPLILIDNAVKYSEQGREVLVTVQDMTAHVLLKVESVGQIVPESMRDAIFERGTRGPNAHKMVSRGSGLGLYIANIVAKAHGTQLRYECAAVDRNGKTGKNVFLCDVPL